MGTYYIDTKFRLGDVVISKLTKQEIIIGAIHATFVHDYGKVYTYSCRDMNNEVAEFTEVELEEVKNEDEVNNSES